MALLAGIIQRGGDDTLAKLTEDDFININNKKILSTLQHMWMESKPISFATVKAEKPDLIIHNILSADDLIIATKTEIEELASAMKNASALRKINKLTNVIKHSIKTENDAKAVKTKILETLSSINTDIYTTNTKDLKTVLFETTEWVEKQYKKAKESDLMLTGIPDLDYYIGGFFDGEMTVIAARPSVGKTALGLYTALRLSKQGHKVLFVSREMSHTALGMRIMSVASGIDTGKIKAGILTDKDWVSLAQSFSKYDNTNLIIDTTSKTPLDIKTIARELEAKNGLDLIIIDYLQILSPDGKHNNREQEVASISRNLKSLSLDMDKPILVLAQLNRNAQNKRPTLADLRESGAIEADADNVWFLHYPSENQLNSNEQKDRFMMCRQKGFRYTEIIIGKHRNGPVGMLDVLFDPRKMQFSGFAKDESS